MPRRPLTDITVRALKAETQTDFWDTKTPGFGVRVGPYTKTFMVKVGNRRTTIGPYPDISLADARRQALAAKAEVRTSAVRIPKVGEALTLYLAYVAERNRPRVQYERTRVLRKHILPTLGSKAVDLVDDRDIGRILDGLVKTPAERNHAFKEARTFFRWMTKPPRRFIRFSPLTGMEMPVKEKRRRRVLADAELVSVWRAGLRTGYPFGDMVRLLILLGQRRGEVAALQWPWINNRERLITLPEWLTKNGVEHTFPYGDRAAEIFETIPRLNRTQLLFPARGHDDRPFNGYSKAKAELERRPSIRAWTLHDLRRTFSTRLGNLDVPQRVNDRLLNHISQGEISPLGRVYNLAAYLPQMRDAIARFEGHLTDLLAHH